VKVGSEAFKVIWRSASLTETEITVSRKMNPLSEKIQNLNKAKKTEQKIKHRNFFLLD